MALTLRRQAGRRRGPGRPGQALPTL